MFNVGLSGFFCFFLDVSMQAILFCSILWYAVLRSSDVSCFTKKLCCVALGYAVMLAPLKDSLTVEEQS